MNNPDQKTTNSEPRIQRERLPARNALILRTVIGLGVVLGSQIADTCRAARMDWSATMAAPQPNQDAATPSNQGNSNLTDESGDEITITPVLPRRKPNSANQPSIRELLPIDLIATTQIPGDSRQAVPTSDQQRDSAKQIKSLLSDEYADRSSAGRSALAKKLLQLSIETDSERVTKWICADEARQLAIEAADVETAWAAGDQLCENYAVDEVELRLNTVSDLMRKINNPVAAIALIERCQPMVQRLIDDDEYQAATAASKELLTIARKRADKFTTSSLEKLLGQLKLMERGYKTIQPQLNQLITNPVAPAANQIVGEFHCFVKRDFAKGVHYLKNGEDGPMQALAVQELAQPTETNGILSLGNGWWDLAGTRSDEEAEAIRMHARALYFKIYTELTGESRAQVDKRMIVDATISLLSISAPGVLFDIVWEDRSGQRSTDVLMFAGDGTYQRSSSISTLTGSWTMKGNIVTGKAGVTDYYFFNDAHSLVCECWNAASDDTPATLNSRGIGKRKGN